MSTIGVAAASYEGSLFSWRGECAKEEREGLMECELAMTSGFHCCAGSIRCVSTSSSGRYMACGASDERIHIFNMLDNVTLGELSTHTGAVTCLDFFEDSYLLSGSDDNSICIWRTHDWMCVHILGGHKGSINCVSIHPSGKLAVSVAQDNTLKVWNLVQGRIAFTRRLKGSANLVKWLKPSGSSYLLVVGSKIEVYSTDDNSNIALIQHETRVNQANFLGSDGNVVSICEDKHMRLFNSRGEMISLVDFSPLNTRIRDFSLVSPSISNGKDEMLPVHAMALATSNGTILVVNLDSMDIFPPASVETETSSITPLEDIVIDKFDIKAEPRLTCISAWVQSDKKSKNKKARKKTENINDDYSAGSDKSGSHPKKKSKTLSGSENESSQKTVRFSEEDSGGKKSKQSKKKKKGKK